MNNKLQFVNTTVLDNKLVQNQYQFENETIYVVVSDSMIFVSHVDFDGLVKLIEADKYEEYRASDITDECAYFLDDDDLEDYVKYAITETLIAYIRRIKK